MKKLFFILLGFLLLNGCDLRQDAIIHEEPFDVENISKVSIPSYLERAEEG